MEKHRREELSILIASLKTNFKNDYVEIPSITNLIAGKTWSGCEALEKMVTIK